VRWWIAGFVAFILSTVRQLISFHCSGCHGDDLLIWDLQMGEAETEPRRLHGHSDLIHSVAFSPDGRFLASGDKNGKVMVWRTKVNPFPNNLNNSDSTYH
jgi:WD40 repeat protein